MSAHTLGPWIAVGQVVKTLRGEANIAHITQMYGDTSETTAANAHLIAAAPDLLETLRVARERIQEDRDSLFESVVSHDGSNAIHDEEDRAEVEKYDALLRVIDGDVAKAEGA